MQQKTLWREAHVYWVTYSPQLTSPRLFVRNGCLLLARRHGSWREPVSMANKFAYYPTSFKITFLSSWGCVITDRHSGMSAFACPCLGARSQDGLAWLREQLLSRCPPQPSRPRLQTLQPPLPSIPPKLHKWCFFCQCQPSPESMAWSHHFWSKFRTLKRNAVC